MKSLELYRKEKMGMRGLVIFLLFMGLILFSTSSFAVTGVCSNCHTMHYSQDGTRLSGWGTAGPYDYLLIADCLGCHAMGTANAIETIGTSQVPQVMHTDTRDLAGGNFAYILGVKGPGADDSYGHNVVDFGASYKESTLYNPPGAHHAGQVTADELTCAGENGCHGLRDISGSPPNEITGIVAMKGSHHRDVDGQLDVADQPWNSYRFLWGVKGYEDTDWQYTSSATDHNEYFGASTPMSLSGCSSTQCHPGGDVNYVKPASQTISGFCATCHGTFHSLEGIGGDTSSPFVRHPTDVVLPSTGEFSAYNGGNPGPYSLDAPLARQTVPASSSSTVNLDSDVVMCLSCHKAHATQYPDMLRWDYSSIVTGGSGGCHICHTNK